MAADAQNVIRRWQAVDEQCESPTVWALVRATLPIVLWLIGFISYMAFNTSYNATRAILECFIAEPSHSLIMWVSFPLEVVLFIGVAIGVVALLRRVAPGFTGRYIIDPKCGCFGKDAADKLENKKRS